MSALTLPTTAMVWIAGGEFVMGSDDHYPEEAPAHRVAVDGFWIDRTPVTNRDFRAFVEASGYRTVAERAPNVADYPGIPAERLVAGSAVFVPGEVPADQGWPSWWEYRPGACWHAPEGPTSSVNGRLDHPVVHVAFPDAVTYAQWLGKRLPTEAEWELAARGGLAGAPYAWGAEATVDGRVPANVWGPGFPYSAPGEVHGTTDVTAFPANRFGLFDMVGNTWEWTSDWFEPGHNAPCCTRSNPTGPSEPTKDPLAMGGALRVLKGGSFLCADNYCARYRPAARIPQAEDSAACNVGFRCATQRPPPGTGHPVVVDLSESHPHLNTSPPSVGAVSAQE